MKGNKEMIFHQLYCSKCFLFYITKTTTERCRVCGTVMSADYIRQACESKRRSKMIVKHDGKVYQVVFKKIFRTATRKKKKVYLIDTECTIRAKSGFDGIPNPYLYGYELCSGISKQYIKDKYSKILGKKYALLYALNSFGSVEVPNTKAFRTALWKKFYETFGGWK